MNLPRNWVLVLGFLVYIVFGGNTVRAQGCPAAYAGTISASSTDFRYAFLGHSDPTAPLFPNTNQILVPSQRLFRIRTSADFTTTTFTLTRLELCVLGCNQVIFRLRRPSASALGETTVRVDMDPAVVTCPTLSGLPQPELDRIIIRFKGPGAMYVWGIGGDACSDDITTTPAPTTQPPTTPPPTTPPPTTPPPPTQLCGACGYSKFADAGVTGGSVPTAEIAEGWQARQHEFPYQVLVGVDCGGVLLNEEFVLTAAHCITQQQGAQATTGAHDRRLSVTEPNKQVHAISEYIIHELYNDRTYENDIALMRLATPLTEFTEYAYPACLPAQDSTTLIGVTMVASGWGFTETFARPTILRYATLPVMARQPCDQCFTDNVHPDYKLDVTEGMMCGGECGDPKGASCQGDSGGPLAYKNADGCFEVVGIVSWGVNCSRDTPSVYTDVYQYLGWINSKMTPAPPPKP